ncbi:hypothetical protein [Herbaspirillum huttiense]|uniref:hypothetical protein n=1 Tax=Herbaspirillum huttiense TaxID=863372 RepID=UPI0031E45BDF
MPMTAPKIISPTMLELFQIERGMTLTVRLNDRSSRRYEQCVLSRIDDVVTINSRDFAGSTFQLIVDLREGTVGFPSQYKDILSDAVMLKVVYSHVVRMLEREEGDADSIFVKHVGGSTALA